uniref:Uncharacterized protein n=1 Tax=viral metagenome TaxID=1070528 RepID=A0A6C0BMM1_9ZZZZ
MTTVVTAYFDLAKIEGTNRANEIDYFQWAEALMATDCDMVIFIDHHLYDRVLNMRGQYKHRTLIIPCSLDDIPTMQKGKYTETKHSTTNSKDTSLYKCLTWCKLDFIKMAIDMNPFNSRYFSWVDFGIFKVHRSNEMSFRIPQRDDQICLHEIIPTFQSDISDLNSFYSTFRHNIAGGYFSGSIESLTWFIDEFHRTLDESISQGHRVHEQNLFGVIVARNYDRIDFSFGDYSEILGNLAPSGIALHLEQINKCMSLKRYDHALRRCQYLRSKVHEDDLFKVLDATFLSAYYSNRKDICSQIADEYLSSCPLEHRSRVQSNLRYIA